MSINIKLLNNDSKEISKLFNYCTTEKNLHISSSKEIKYEAKMFFVKRYSHKNPSQLKKLSKELSTFSFYDIKNYETPKLNNSFYITLVKLGRFKTNLVNLVNPPQEQIDFRPLERRVSPPLKAYKPIHHTKLNITPTGRSYGTLFE